MAHDDFSAELAGLQQQFGVPQRVDFSAEMLPDEFALVQRSVGRGRYHDVTIFIHYQGKFVVIEKHAYAHTGILRAPSGGANADESLIDAAKREAREETGFEIEVERFILESHVQLTLENEKVDWVSYVFLARVTGGEMVPQDLKEIAGVHLRSREELLNDIGPLMKASGLGGFEYRAKMTEAFFAELDAQGIQI